MKKYEVFNDFIKKIKNDDSVDGIILVGKVKDTSMADFQNLNDIDIFIINDTNTFEREIIEINTVCFDISYISINILKKIIKEKMPLMINILSSSKIIYYKNDNLCKLIKDIKLIYDMGPSRIKKNEINYIRFKLYDLYKDALNRKGDTLTCSLLLNNLISYSIESYFLLNNQWRPKDKNILNKIKELDFNLYSIITDFILSIDLLNKLDLILNIINYITEPFGGIIKELNRSEFPLDK